MLDIRTAQTTLENLIRDAVLFAMGWRLPPVTSVALLRAVPTQGQTSTIRYNDDLIAVMAGGAPVTFRWSSASRVADDGVSTVQPADVGAGNSGRWIALPAWASIVRFSPVVGGPSYPLGELASGSLRRVIVLDKDMEDEEVMNLITGDVPAVTIVATDDEPEDAVSDAGFLWNKTFNFTVTSIAENLRDRREAAQDDGTANVPGDVDIGTNTIDGFLQALLAAGSLCPAESDLQVVRIGRGWNWVSDMGQRRVMRSRIFSFRVNVELPQAPNEAGPVESIRSQAHLMGGAITPAATTTLPATLPTASLTSYLIGGMNVAYPTFGFVQPVAAGTALIAGAAVSYAGESPTFAAYSDTYRDLLPSGAMVFTAVASRAQAPALATGALRIGVTSTGGAGVLADLILAQTNALLGASFVIKP